MPPLASHSHIRAERRRYRRAQDGRSWSVKDLPKFYYHRNFCEIIDSVGTENEEGFVAPVGADDGRDYFISLTKPELAQILSDHVCETLFKKSWKKEKLINIAVNEIDFDTLILPQNIWVQSKTDIGWINRNVRNLARPLLCH